MLPEALEKHSRRSPLPWDTPILVVVLILRYRVFLEISNPYLFCPDLSLKTINHLIISTKQVEISGNTSERLLLWLFQCPPNADC